MLERKLTQRLKEWKKRPHKSLLLLGARQVGKTYSCRQFGAAEYDHVLELNFVEQPEAASVFEGNLDVDTLVSNLSLYYPSVKLVPGKSLVILDEIQQCPRVLTSLKFWTQDQRFDVIATGSSLGVAYKSREVSFPVGQIETMHLYALDFEEFLWAQEIAKESMETLRKYFEDKTPVPEAMHRRMLELLRVYMITGGMPEVVQRYVDTRDLNQVHFLQKEIYSNYLIDIAHYAPGSDKIKAEKCFRSIPVQLGKENHKFQYSVVEHKGTGKKFESSIDWLKASFMIRQIDNLKRIELPPQLFADENNFRIYMTDIGLMVGTYPYELKRAVMSDSKLEEKPAGLLLGTAKGGLYEALAADFLNKKEVEALYFYKDEKSTSEVEFVYENADGMIPVEIKAGKKRANSLARLLESDHVPYGYKLSSQNVGMRDKLITLPLYMLLFL